MIRYLAILMFPIFVSAEDATPLITTETEETTPESIQFTTSEIHHRPAKGVSEFKTGPKIQSHHREYSDFPGSTDSYDFRSSVLDLNYNYGLSETVSLQLSTDYGFDEQTRSTKSYVGRFSGFSDLKSGISYAPAATPGLNLNLSLYVSPTTAVYANRKTSGNRFSGGNSLEATVGYESRLSSPVILGTQLGFRYYGERTGGLNDYVENTTGGHRARASVFGEYFISEKSSLGLIPEVVWIGPSESSDNTGDFATYDPNALLSVHGYGRFQVGQTVTLLPSLGYETLLNRTVNGLEYPSYGTIAANLNARFEL